MTPDPIAITPEVPFEARSTAGMTTKVVKGSLWTLLGQILPMAVALIATPFTIRFLGSEGYGVLILVGLIPTYFAFADFGMGIASTKFASEAYGEGNREKEAEIVRTAALIAICFSLIFALPIFVFSSWIVAEFNVPDNFRVAAGVALKITSLSFVLGILSSVVNTPMLARLRMDMNSIAGTVPKVLMAAATPFVLFLGGGIVEAVWVGFFATVLGISGILYFSGKLLPELLHLSINRHFFRPLLKFGGGWLVASVAIILLSNLEKFLLTRFTSVRSLAYYSIAFTLASMATMLPIAMTQSLLPAFSQLLAPEKRKELQILFSRTIRLNFIWLLPILMIAFVMAKPFLMAWAGREFVNESSNPFYILLIGLFFNVVAYVPYAALVSSGKTGLLGKVYFIELTVYALIATLLISRFGILGAAMSWSLRVTVDAVVLFFLAKRIFGTDIGLSGHLVTGTLALCSLLPPVLYAAFYDNFSVLLILLAFMSCGLYAYLAWNRMVDSDERAWLSKRALSYFE